MLAALIEFPLWIFGSLVVLSVQYSIVAYTIVLIAFDVAAYLCIQVLRDCLTALPSFVPLLGQTHVGQTGAMLNQMRLATSFSSWRASAERLDKLRGAVQWRSTTEDEAADLPLLARSTAQLAELRTAGDIQAMLPVLHTVLHRGYGGVDVAELYARSFIGTKHVVEKFFQELRDCLQLVQSAQTQQIAPKRKRIFLQQASMAAGRTALALSGGGALCMYHCGVVRALITGGCMPRVVSGTSGGSIIAGLLALHTNDEIVSDVFTPKLATRHGVSFFDPLPNQLLRFGVSVLKQQRPRFVETEAFRSTCQRYFGFVTFEEAFRRTGRVVSITVTARYSGTAQSHAILLNYITAPKVFIWSAVVASCALPGLMTPASLYAKSPSGGVEPVHDEAAVHILDGSMHSDIPSEQLMRMFHVDRFVVSQVNPHISPFLREGGPHAAARHSQPMQHALRRLQLWLNLDIQARTHKLARLRLLPRMFGQDMHGMFTQRYRGHVTIAPGKGRFLDSFKALSHPSEEDLAYYVLVGERATWPHLPHVRALMAMEQALDDAAGGPLPLHDAPPKLQWERQQAQTRRLGPVVTPPLVDEAEFNAGGNHTGPPSTPPRASHAGAPIAWISPAALSSSAKRMQYDLASDTAVPAQKSVSGHKLCPACRSPLSHQQHAPPKGRRRAASH